MQPPDELMVDTFLPSMRLLVAKELRRKGHGQSSISKMLGVTQASVSMYFSADPRKAYAALAELQVGEEEARRYTELLSEDLERSSLDAQATLGAIWRELLASGRACDAHRAAYPSLVGCDICMKAPLGGRGGPDAIESVAKAVASLEASSTFARAMPEVSVNLAYSPPGAVSSDEVVAVPGRIVRIKGRASAMHSPEYGASRHLASLLLLVARRHENLRACINLRYDDKMEETLRALGVSHITIGGYRDSGPRDPTAEALTQRLKEGPKKFEAVVDTGGKGIEPNVYIFAETPAAVARRALEVAGDYSIR